MNQNYLYAARRKDNGKLSRHVIATSKKYWDRRDSAEKAINDYNRTRLPHQPELELVVFQLVEVKPQ
jgi:hypothetical protein